MSILYTFLAPAGSGKSTFARKFSIQHNPPIPIISSDEIRKEITGDVSDMSQDGLVWRLAVLRTQACLTFSDAIFDATNVKTKNREIFLKQIKYDKIVFICFKDITSEICKSRIKKDLENNVDRSNVPDNVIDDMFFHYENSLKKLIDNKEEILWV